MKTTTLVVAALLLTGCNDKPAKNFAMLGDSIIEMMGQYQKTLPEPFKSAANFGVGGQTSTQIAVRIGLTSGYANVLLEGGINNLDSPGQIVADYTAMLKAIPVTTPVTLLGIIQLDEAQLAISVPGSALTNAKVNAVMVQINAACAGFSNCHPASKAQTGSMAGLTLDGIHPNASGYSAITTRITSP